MGMTPFIMGAVAAIIGGIGNMRGIVVAALALSGLQQAVSWYWGGQWRDPAALLMLLGFLLVKPEGFFGKKSEKAFV